MSPFEYVMVLISIILGLGITTLLTGIAEWIKLHSPSGIYAPYIIWIALVFVLHIHEWWISYSLQSIPVWQLPLFLLIILYPINLYVLAHVIFPKDMASFSSKIYYLENYPKFFILAIILGILSMVDNVVLSGFSVTSQIPQALLLLILSSVLVTKSKNEGVHLFIAVLLLIIMVISFIVTKETLQIGEVGN